VDYTTLKTNPSNPRLIKKKQFEDLKKSIGSFTKMLEVRPIAYDESGVIWGGNMRFQALKALGIEMKPEYFKELTGYTEAELHEFAIRDNIELGEWDDSILANEWDDYPLEEWGINTEGWDEEIVEDEAPEVSKEPVVSQLGRHKLMCGDSTLIGDVEKLMGGERADMVFTSPPYNMGGKMYENYEDNLKSQEYIDFNLETIHTWLPYIKGYLFWNISYNKNSRWEFLEIMYRIIKETGLRFLEMIVWDKGHGLPITSTDMLTRQYEDILFVGDDDSVGKDMDLFYLGTKYKRAFFNKKTNRGITNYWKVDTNRTQLENHLACFPVKLPAKAIKLVTQPGEIVVDMFGGSGSTLMACEQLSRVCYMCELDNRYTDVIIKRWQTFTGQEAIRVSDGKKWNELSQEIPMGVKTENTTKDTTEKTKKG
jgi:site-specific DNA-methyltransferase (adenine-specific)